MTKEKTSAKRTGRGFSRASSLLQSKIKKAGQSRGFAVSRLLTQWEEIVGPEIASGARPVKITYGREGIGAKLTLLTSGAMAPMLQMQTERIRQKVNACYGYAAISKIHITQTAPEGFAESQTPFKHEAKAEKIAPSADAKRLVEGVTDAGLRNALEQLSQNIISKRTT